MEARPVLRLATLDDALAIDNLMKASIREIFLGNPGEIALADAKGSAPELTVRVVAHEKPAFGEPLKGVAGDVDGRRLAIEDEFRQARTNRWGGLEPGP